MFELGQKSCGGLRVRGCLYGKFQGYRRSPYFPWALVEFYFIYFLVCFSEGQSGRASTIGQKIIFVIGNLVNLGLAMYKCHSMGLLPTHASDWLAFADPVERVEWAFV